MQKKETAIEVKVGALVILSLGLLVAFVLLLGDFRLQEGFTIYVDYDNAAGLKPGADVAISGIKAGRVEQIEFLGGKLDPDVGRPVMVRAKLVLEDPMKDAVRRDSEFYITTQGVLGEKYIEILTRDLSSPPLASEAKVRGVDPPRIELMLAKASDLLTDISDLLGRDDVPVGDLIRNANSLTKHADEILVENRGTLKNLLTNTDETVTNAKQLTASLNEGVGDGTELRETLVSARNLTETLERRAPVILNKGEVTLDHASSLAQNLDELTTERRPQIERTLDNVERVTTNLDATTTDVRGMVQDVKDGKGSVGALLKDEEIYDDLKETLRELKRRPWKIIWKE